MTTPYKILVIDDDPQVRTLLCEVLQTNGYYVETATDGEQGIEKFIRDKQDLVITDIVMPKKEGIETILDLKRLSSDIKILAISGGNAGYSQNYLTIAEMIGSDCTLQKPFTNQELLTTVNKILAIPI